MSRFDVSVVGLYILDVLGRQAELMRLGDASVDDAVATIMDEAQAALDAL